MAEGIGTSIDNLDGDEEALKQFEKRRVGRRIFFACDCVAYTPEQLGLKTKSRRPPAGPPGGPPMVGASSKNVAKWPRGVVPYRFGATAPTSEAKTLFREACRMWEDKLGNNAAGRKFVSFVEVASAGSLFLTVTRWDQRLNQASTGAVSSAFVKIGILDRGSLVHELGHVLGLVHEHQRHDRDQFITCNALALQNSNFRKHSTAEDTVRTAYDFGSIMHYPRRVQLPGGGIGEMTPKAQFQMHAASMGQRTGPSENDVAAVKLIYP